MKKIIGICLLSTSLGAFAQDTGQFEISKTNFKDLYNSHRFSSPKVIPWSGNFFPYGDDGTAVKLNKNGDKSSEGTSPIEAYAKLSGASNEAIEWEQEYHGCKNYDSKTRKSCESWWGHCNGWAAAAIKEKEPRGTKKLKGNELSVADQKGILSELWLSSYSMNAGLTDKSLKTKSWVHKHDRPSEAYRNFWDVTPKAFFLIFTNYIGVLKTGVVIDRFTGDEVWNQPIVGYRLLPIRDYDVSEIKGRGHSYWSVKIRIKIYWANDLGIRHGHISKPFSIDKMSDNAEVEELSKDYEGRYLAFRLNFDSKVRVSADGKTVLSAGKIIGEGLWEHQEDSKKHSYEELNHTHPDFIWLPTQAFQDQYGYGNPYMDSSVVQKLVEGKESAGKIKKVVLKLIFAPSSFEGSASTASKVKKKVASVIRRDGIKHAIYVNDIAISRNRVVVPVRFPLEIDENSLVNLFNAAGIKVRIGK